MEPDTRGFHRPLHRRFKSQCSTPASETPITSIVTYPVQLSDAQGLVKVTVWLNNHTLRDDVWPNCAALCNVFDFNRAKPPVGGGLYGGFPRNGVRGRETPGRPRPSRTERNRATWCA